LEKWNPDGGATFETYICNVLFWGSLKRKRNAEHAPELREDMDDFIDEENEQEINERIEDYKKFLHLHGGNNLKSMLGVLQQKMRGDPIKNLRAANQYRNMMSNFIAMENLPIYSCTGYSPHYAAGFTGCIL
jgi:hypothetical protein